MIQQTGFSFADIRVLAKIRQERRKSPSDPSLHPTVQAFMRALPIIENPQASEGPLASENPQGKRGAYAFISLGCPKNLVDSEQMLGILHERGYRLVQDPEESDFVVINTCGFIDHARKESFEAIDQMLDLKRSGKIRGVVITGCLAERQNEQLLEERPEIDGLVGVFGRDEIGNLVDRIMDGLDEQRSVFRPAPIRALSDHMRLQVTPKHFAYLKISEGCDRLCTFCAIPKMRGKHASKPPEDILVEAKRLTDNGVRELIIVAQDTTYYGIDMFGEPRLRQLLEELDQVEGLDWIRLMYFYPMYIDKALMSTIGQSKRILPYIDMPLQHINNTMLKRMSRRVTQESTVEMVSMMRETIPELVLRTTMITGFPGETDEQFEDLVEFVDRMHFERLGVFTYSIEPDTPAARLDEHLPERIKKERRNRLMAVQQKNAFDWCAKQLGKKLPILIDKAVEVTDTPQKGKRGTQSIQQAWIGRSYADAPDVDACVYVSATEDVSVKPGDLVECEIVSSDNYDLIGAALRVIQ